MFFVCTTVDSIQSHPTLFVLYSSLPPDCTMDDLISVLGSGRMKKMARKNRRTRNEKIREGKVVMNEKGEWVPGE